MRIALLPLLIVAVVSTACAEDTRTFEAPDVAGPARVQMDVVVSHAESFDREVPDRPAGSGAEQAAAAYLTGTLQQNGYFVRLDPVPVGDLVRSTNIIGEPSGIPQPGAVVVVAYDTGPDSPSNGIGLGLFLELARALNVAQPAHAVYFIALGADHASQGGGHLGSRRLARFMLDEGWDPLVVQLVDVTEGASIAVAGDDASGFTEVLGSEPEGLPEASPDVFKRAGFRRLLVSGDPVELGPALLDYLQRYES